MDPSLNQSSSSDEWDDDGFVIPSLAVEDSNTPELTDSKPPAETIKEEAKIYLGPHGPPPSQAKQQELASVGRKHWLKHKLKEADRRDSGSDYGSGRENKLENLRELVGSKTTTTTTTTTMTAKSSTRDWLDPHCHESQFERYSHSPTKGPI